MTPEKERAALAFAIREQLRRHGESISDLARSAGVTRPTLSNWMRHNRFPAEFVEKVARAAHIDASAAEIRERYSFEAARWSWARPPRGKRASSAGEARRDAFVRPFVAAEEGDVVLSVFTDELPVEWSAAIGGGPVDQAAATMTRTRARVVYVAPSEETLEAWRAEWGLRVPSDIADLHRRVCMSGLSESLGQSLLVQPQNLPLLVPGLRLVARMAPVPPIVREVGFRLAVDAVPQVSRDGSELPSAVVSVLERIAQRTTGWNR